MEAADAGFAGSIPQIYEQYLVPLIFASYAADIAALTSAHQPGSVLEIAAGTGAVTRRLANALPSEVSLVATDLNQAMLDQAVSAGTSRPVVWKQADVMRLPFGDASFDAVVCQFGAMFFPDKARAFGEVHRVLRPGGIFLFNIWDRIEHNEFADVITRALEALFPAAPPQFLVRTPHGYHDVPLVLRDLRQAGFKHQADCSTVPKQSSADLARIPAIAYCHGTPLRTEIESRGYPDLAAATDAGEEAIAGRFGNGQVKGTIQAHIFTAER